MVANKTAIHEQPQKVGGGEIAQPNPEEMADIKMVKGFLEEGKRVREPFDKNWDKWKGMEEGEQYRMKMPSYRASIPFNILKSTIQTQIPILTDARPKIDVVEKTPEDFAFAEDLSMLINHWWETYSMDLTLIDWITDSMILSGGIIKVVWDQSLNDGLGDTKAELLDPRDVFINENCYDFTKDRGCKWVVHKTTKTVGELKLKYPKKKDEIRADTNEDQDTLESVTKKGEAVLVSPIDRKSTLSDMPTQGVNESAVVEVAEAWVDDQTLIEVELEDEEGNLKPALKKKFPNGKVITILPKQNVRLFAGNNPYKDAEFPFVKFVNIRKPRQFWGEGEVGNLEKLQMAINRVGNMIMDYMNFTGNPIWFVHSGSGVNPNKITNQMGLVITWSGDAHMRPVRDIPPPLPAYYFQFFDQLIRFVENTSGTQDISQGRRPEGITAAEALATLQEAANTRIRLKERNLETALERLTKLVVSRTLQFTREPKKVKITNTPGWPKFFEFTLKDVEDGKIQVDRQEFNMDESKRQFVKAENGFFQGTPTKGLFDIQVRSGTSLPAQKAQRGNMAFRLREGGDISREGLYELIDLPEKEKELKRVEEEQEKLAAQAPVEGV
jgi:hypothetical protein